MKEKNLSFKNLSAQHRQNMKKDPSNSHSFGRDSTDPFAFSLHTFRKCHKNNDQREGKEILDCFNNLSSALEDEPQKKYHEIMKCQKVFKRGDSQFSLPKFSSIQSGQTSINNSIFEDQIIAINEKSRYQCDDQYSFNGDQTERNSLAPKNTDNKNKYENLIQKIDHFLVKDFNQDNTQNFESCSKRKKPKTFNESKDESKKGHDFKKHQRLNSQKFAKILQEESTVRQKLDFLSTYAQSLEQENTKLKSQISDQQEMEKKLEMFQKQVFEKNIVIEFLTKQLETRNQKGNKQKQNKENKPSNMNIQKQRNTVSAVNILSKSENNPPKCRASHNVESTNQQMNPLKLQTHQKKEFSQGISGDSYNSKSKSNSFMKKIFRKSHQYKHYAGNNKSNMNHGNQGEDAYLIQILKEENSILSTKLNILYGDFQQIIDKYNQVLTEKNICKAKCCRKGNDQFSQSKEIILSDNQVGKIGNSKNKGTLDENQSNLNQIRLILGQITKQQNRPIQVSVTEEQLMQTELYENDDEEELFSRHDLQKLRTIQRQESSQRERFVPKNQPNNSHTDRAVLIKQVQNNISQFDKIQRSFNCMENYRFSMQERYNSTNQEHGQRFSTLVNNREQNTKKNVIFNQNIDLRVQQRQRIAPRESNRQNMRKRVNSCMIK